MKTLPFLLTLGLSTLCSALTIESPRELQVFQRHSKSEGTVKLAGTADKDVRYRINGDWQSIAVDAATHRFEKDITVPAGGWHALEVQCGTESAKVAKFGVGEVFIVAGQSNAANHGSDKLKTETQMVSSFDGKAWSIADDPQHGASGSGGSFMPAFGDALAKRLGVPIGLIPVASGGTSVREWLPKGIKFKQNTTTGKGVSAVGDEFESAGVLFTKLTTPMKELGVAGFRAVLWHQGESDAGQAREGHPADRQISGAQYVEFMENVIRKSRNAAAWPVPWFTAITTYHRESDPPDDEFRGAMQSLWAKGLSWPGPDTDQLRGDLRAGVHFNGSGLRKHGEAWAEKVAPWVEDMVAEPREGPPSKDYKLVWQDEFEGPQLDETKWAHRSVGQRRGAWIDPDCVSFDGQGHMLITVKKVGEEIHGGMIGTEKKKSWTYGYFECRVKVAAEPGMNTAFWMQAPRMGAPDRGQGVADDTRHNGTEIDILEYISRQGDVAHFNLHWNGYGKLHRSTPADGWLHGLADGFHVYGVEWTTKGYDFFIDGHRYWHTEEAVSDTEEYLILDLEHSAWAGGIEKAKLPASAVFDWVRVWQRP
jgi:Glycosyl hydrolases family 16/Carbohydrate esterase, sialic acid-specific acetylesterase